MPLRDGILGETLEMQIERRVDVHRLRGLRDCGKLLGERLADEIDEVRRLGVERAGNRREGLL